MPFLKVERRLGNRADPRLDVNWKTVDTRIADGSGKTIFAMKNVEVPEPWSETATQILAQKYFRKAGVPNKTVIINDIDNTAYAAFARSVPTEDAVFGHEISAHQVFHRLAGCWTYWGIKQSLFANDADANVFYGELYLMLARQMGAPNSPQFFNCGLNWAYGIEGPDSGQWATDENGLQFRVHNSYERPQLSACFIQSVNDDLVNEGGIMPLWVNEARLFKHGSGSGTNYSTIRGNNEPLSSGGKSSGLMSFLSIGDRAAGSIKSGGTSRRAARIVILNADHPDIEDFIDWKVNEEYKAAAMHVGSAVIRETLAEARGPFAEIPQSVIERAAQGYDPHVIGLEMEGEAYQTIDGQNANNSVRVTNNFMDRVRDDADWELTARTTGKTVKTLKARALWDRICRAAWASADPGLQFHDTINEWHTVPADGEIVASNPCCFVAGTLVDTSEGLIDIAELARQSASGKLLPFAFGFDLKNAVPTCSHITKAWVAGHTSHLAEVHLSTGEAFRCTPEHKWLLHDGRYVEAQYLEAGTSLCKVGRLGIGMTVEKVRKIELLVPVPVYDIEVPATHNFAIRPNTTSDQPAAVVSNSEYMFLSETSCNLASLNLVKFKKPDGSFDADLFTHAVRLWTVVLDISVTLAAFPSREIAAGSHNYRTLGLGYANLGGLLMRSGIAYDSDEGRGLAAAITALLTGVAYRTSAELAEICGPFPRFEENREGLQRVLHNHLAAVQAQRKLIPQYDGVTAIPPCMIEDCRDMALYSAAVSVWRNVVDRSKFRNAQVSVIAPTGTISFVMDCSTTGIEPEFALAKTKELAGGGRMTLVNNCVSDGLLALGLGPSSVATVIRQMQSGVPLSDMLLPDKLAVFDTAVPSAGSRALSPQSHVKMMAAVQPYVSGAISKTVNMPNEATVEDVSAILFMAHQLGLKSIAIYRDGCKMAQPMNAAKSTRKAAADSTVSKEIPSLELRSKIYAIHEDRLPRGVREEPPKRRTGGYTQEVNIGDYHLFLTVNPYPDGRAAEMFIELAKQGTTLRALGDMVAMAISVGLQYGVPVEQFVHLFQGLRFEPAGIVEGHERIKMSSSIADLIASELGITFLGRDDMGQVVPAVSLDSGKEVVALDRRAVGIASHGYTGDVCPECHNATLVPAGRCLRCETCGATTGCS